MLLIDDIILDIGKEETRHLTNNDIASSGVKTMSASNLDEIVNLHWQALNREILPKYIFDKLTLTEFRKKILSKSVSDNEITFLARNVEGKSAGFLSLILGDHPSTLYKISKLYVRPEFWRRGVGSLLCHIGLMWIKNRGGTGVVLDVLVVNQPAISFYQKLGFDTKKEKIRNFLGCDMPVLEMHVNLKNAKKT